MNRRETLKALSVISLSSGVLMQGCKSKDDAITDGNNLPASHVEGELEQFEIERLKQINNEPPFFTQHEKLTLILLADIIIPKDEISGSASEANVIDFIEFIVKDIPEHQLPMRGGLKWLDMQCLNRYGNVFRDCGVQQQLELVTEIAYPAKAKPVMRPGVVFFNRMRELTATGFYTSSMGMKDIGYIGNSPNKWEGVPPEVLEQYGLAEM